MYTIPVGCLQNLELQVSSFVMYYLKIDEWYLFQMLRLDETLNWCQLQQEGDVIAYLLLKSATSVPPGPAAYRTLIR